MKAYAIPFMLVLKNNWGTHQNWWGKIEPSFIYVGSMSLLNIALVCICVGLGTSHFVIFSFMGLGNLFWPLIFSLPRHHDLKSFDVKYCQIQCRAFNMFKISLPLFFSTFLWSPVGPDPLSSFSYVSCQLCGKNYGPPSTRSLPVNFNSFSKNLI